MMYPALLNFQIGELKKLAKAPKPILLTLFSNWIIAPLVTAFLAYYFLEGKDQLIIALILLGSSPCTAIVIVWGSMAKGNQEQNVIITSINTITIMFLYAPVVVLLTGIQGIMIDRYELFLSVRAPAVAESPELRQEQERQAQEQEQEQEQAHVTVLVPSRRQYRCQRELLLLFPLYFCILPEVISL